MAFGAVCQQGSNYIPRTIPGRIATIMLFTSLMFLYSSYSANIVALLQSSSTSIQTLDDLLHSRLQVGVDDTVFNRFYFPVCLWFMQIIVVNYCSIFNSFTVTEKLLTISELH